MFTPPASAARTSLSSLIQPSPHDEWSCWWKPTGSVIKASIIWLGTIKQLAEQLWWLTGTLERWREKAHKDWWQQRDSDWTQKNEVISNQSQFLCSWLAHLSKAFLDFNQILISLLLPLATNLNGFIPGTTHKRPACEFLTSTNKEVKYQRWFECRRQCFTKLHY